MLNYVKKGGARASFRGCPTSRCSLEAEVCFNGGGFLGFLGEERGGLLEAHHRGVCETEQGEETRNSTKRSHFVLSSHMQCALKTTLKLHMNADFFWGGECACGLCVGWELLVGTAVGCQLQTGGRNWGGLFQI